MVWLYHVSLRAFPRACARVRACGLVYGRRGRHTRRRCVTLISCGSRYERAKRENIENQRKSYVKLWFNQIFPTEKSIKPRAQPRMRTRERVRATPCAHGENLPITPMMVNSDPMMTLIEFAAVVWPPTITALLTGFGAYLVHRKEVGKLKQEQDASIATFKIEQENGMFAYVNEKTKEIIDELHESLRQSQEEKERITKQFTAQIIDLNLQMNKLREDVVELRGENHKLMVEKVAWMEQNMRLMVQLTKAGFAPDSPSVSAPSVPAEN